MKLNWKRWPTLLLLVSFAGWSLACPPEDDDEPDREDLSVSVDNHTLQFDEADAITIEEATIDRPGFVVIYDDDDGQQGDIIGSSDRIDEGTTEDFEATLDRNANDGETMWAVLHYDPYDETDDFENAAKQPPATDADGDIVRDSFDVTVEDEPVTPEEPSITIDDQTLPEDNANTVNVDEVVTDEGSFAVIYDDDGGEPGGVIGSSELLEEGTHTDFDVDLDRDANDGETLRGVLHYDRTDAGEFEDPDDQPAATDDDDNEVRDSFVVTVEEEPVEDEPSVSVTDQNLDELSTVVTVDEVEALEDGWIVVHRNSCDDFGAIIGNTFVEQGTTSTVEVELNEPAADRGSSRDLCAMLHSDDGDESFDGADDLPVEDSDGDIVMETMNIEVVDGTPAVRVTLDAETGPPSWSVENVEPSTLDEAVDTSGDPPTFQLRNGWRYEVDNRATADIAFEFRNDTNGVLLSQELDGDDAPLEDVGSINWSEDGDAFLFNVSDDFQNDTDVVDDAVFDGSEAVTQYGAFDQGNMTGPVIYLE